MIVGIIQARALPRSKLKSKSKPVLSRHRAARKFAPCQPPPEKCTDIARANEPKPPRLTLPELESEAPDDAWFDEESPLKKLLRDHTPPDELPWP
jgi:hypothetical protein